MILASIANASEVTVSSTACGNCWGPCGFSAAGLSSFRFGGRQRFGELPQALVDLFKGLGAPLRKAVERHAQISFQDVALPFFASLDRSGRRWKRHCLF